ncbi:avidin-like [Crotalus adamanteus]|uniref:Avidin-like n=1 Tax=Crotalus adamanteus TaxID=8729 RepID=A0AAW1C2K6_CROAD
MAIGLAALGLLAFMLGCSGNIVEPQNSKRDAKVRCGVAGRGSQPPPGNPPPATSLCSGGRQEQLVGAGGLHRGCRFLGVDRTRCRRAERQRPWVPDGRTPSVSSSVLGRDFGSLPPGLVLSLAAQMAERSAGGSRPGRGLAGVSTDGLWDAPPLPAPPGCSLTGSWVDDKGDKIVINHNINGMFNGFYLTAEGATNKTIPPLMLQGIQHLEPQPTFGFILMWNTSASTAVFVGQCFVDDKGKEQLKTAALLRRKLASVAENWGATSARPGALLVPIKVAIFLVTWMELLQGRPPKTKENSPSVLPLIRRGLQCLVGDLAGPVRP